MQSWNPAKSGVYDADGVCVAMRHPGERDNGKWKANALLIAAAPELLEACQIVEAELNVAIRSKVLGETWTSLQLLLARAVHKAENLD